MLALSELSLIEIRWSPVRGRLVKTRSSWSKGKRVTKLKVKQGCRLRFMLRKMLIFAKFLFVAKSWNSAFGTELRH